MFQNILVATARADGDEAAVLTAVRFAQKNRSALHILHVLEVQGRKNHPLVKHYQTGRLTPCSPAYQQQMEENIRRICDSIPASRPSCHAAVIFGLPWEEIMRYSRRTAADLIVLGIHRERAAPRDVIELARAIGSTAQGVIMHADCPVMIVRRPITEKQLRLKRILAAIDFSNACRKALRFAVQLARRHTAQLHVYHMLPVPPSNVYSQDDYQTDRRVAAEKIENLCAGLPADIHCEYSVSGGVFPGQEIIDRALAKDVDLIVMGSHTKERSGKWYTGSAVEIAGAQSTCPVIVLTDTVKNSTKNGRQTNF